MVPTLWQHIHANVSPYNVPAVQARRPYITFPPSLHIPFPGAVSRVVDRGTRGMSFILGAAVFNVAPTILEVWKCVEPPPITYDKLWHSFLLCTFHAAACPAL